MTEDKTGLSYHAMVTINSVIGIIGGASALIVIAICIATAGNVSAVEDTKQVTACIDAGHSWIDGNCVNK